MSWGYCKICSAGVDEPTPDEVIDGVHYCRNPNCYAEIDVTEDARKDFLRELLRRIEKLETEVGLLGGDT
jgi:hypothetical protein